MPTLIIDLPPEVYDRLARAAHEQHKTVEALARERIAERAALAARVAVPGATPLSEIIIEERGER